MPYNPRSIWLAMATPENFQKPGAEFMWPVRVYYEDTDSGGVVYYANYLKFMERARTEMLRTRGYQQDQLKQEQGIVFAVHSVSIKYEKPAIFNDELMVITRITSRGRASLTFAQHIQRNCDQTRLCHAEIKVACLHADTFTACAMPQSIYSTLGQEI